MMLMALVFLMILWSLSGQGSKENFKSSEIRIPHLYVGLTLLIPFVLFLFKYMDPISFELLIPHHDYVNYGNVAAHLISEKFEGLLVTVGMQDPVNYPYHYNELWLSGLLSQTFGINETYCLLLVVFPFYFLVFMVQILALGREFLGDLKLLQILVLLSFAGATGIYFSWLGDLIPFYKEGSLFSSQALSYHKLILIQLGLGFVSIFFLREERRVALFFLTLIPFLFISTLPAIGGMIGITLLGKIIIKKFDPQVQIKDLVLSLLTLTLLVGFYSFFGPKANEGINTGGADIWNLRTRINILVGTGIQIILLFFLWLPLIVLTARYIKLHSLNLFVFFLVLLTIGLMSWIVLFFATNSVQFFSNLFAPVLSWALILLLIKFYESEIKRTKLGRYALVLCFFLLAYNWGDALENRGKVACDPDYISQSIKLSKGVNPHGAFIKSKDDYYNYFQKIPSFSTLGNHLALKDGRNFNYSLSVHDTPLANERDRTMVQNSVFFKYATDDIALSQYEFVIEKDIDLLFLSEKAIMPQSLDSIFSLKATNRCSGEKLFLRNKD